MPLADGDLSLTDHEGTFLALVLRIQPVTAYLVSKIYDGSPVSNFNTSKGKIYPLIRRLDHAMVAVNGVKFTGHPIPFGGMKASGLGREGGTEGFEAFVETKYFCLHHQGQF